MLDLLFGKGVLNPEQQAAILEDCSVFLIACPGSGKTRTLTYKIAYELTSLEPKKFLIAITYTHRAADEIQERIENLGIDTSRLRIGTIHSFCLEWILKPYALYHPILCHGFSVIDPHERERLLDQLCKPYSRPKITHWDCDFYYTDEGYYLACQDAYKHEHIKQVLEQYFHHLDSNHLVDFELILYYSYELIRDHPCISKILSKIFSMILIDEYQDTKHIQYLILSSIIKAGNGLTKIFIVGDPNQSIFQSLGGYPIEQVELEKFCGIKLTALALDQNYRSTSRLIQYFSQFNVHKTKICPASNHKNFLSPISFNDSIDVDGLVDEFVRILTLSIEKNGIKQEEICILAPQWIPLAQLSRQLVARLPHYEFDAPGMVPFARDFDNFWFKLSQIALTESSPKIFVRRLRWAKDIINDLHAAGVDVSSMTTKGLLREVNSIRLNESEGLVYLKLFFHQLFKQLGIDLFAYPALAGHYQAFFERSENRITQLKAKGADYIGDLATFKKVFQVKNGITISSIHGIKGAEFDVVIAYGLLEGMVPHFNDKDAKSPCRLLYVIASRAKRYLHLFSERGRDRVTTKVLAAYLFDYDNH